MKQVMLMRHGAYFDSNLSAGGQAEVDQTALDMIEQGLIPDVIIHSPVERAVETAERVRDIFNRVAGKSIPLVVNNKLSVGCTRTDELVKDIDEKEKLVLAVTHQPNVESLSYAFGREVSPQTAEVSLFESNADQWKDVQRARLVKTFR